MPFVEPQTLTDQCAERLRSAILDGSYAPDTRLPPERVLAEEHGVSRLTMRAALLKVEAAGLLRVRQGSGYRVQDPHEVGGPQLIPSLVGLDEGGVPVATELLRVRRHLAMAVLESLLESPPKTAPLHSAIGQLQAGIDRGEDSEAIAELDAKVLRTLLDLTNSSVLQLTVNPIRSLMREWPALREAMYRNPQDNVTGWTLLAVWLEDPEPEGMARIKAVLEERDAATLDAMAR